MRTEVRILQHYRLHCKA